MNAASTPLRHAWYDDALAFATGTLFIAIGVTMYTHAGLLTGGTAGLAFLAHYATGIGFGPLFFAINLPFYLLAWKAMGRSFTLKTFAAVTLRLWLPALQAASGSFVEAYRTVAWLCWVPNVIVAEFIIHARASGYQTDGTVR